MKTIKRHPKAEYSKWRHLSSSHQLKHHSPATWQRALVLLVLHIFFFLSTVMKINFNSGIILKGKYTT